MTEKISKVSEGNNANHYWNAFFMGKIASKKKKSVFLFVYNPVFFNNSYKLLKILQLALLKAREGNNAIL